MNNKKTQNVDQKYICELCHYCSNNLYDFNKHNNTKKHKTREMIKNGKEITHKPVFTCDCGKSYAYASGLSLHKKRCIFMPENKIKDLEAKLDQIENEKQELQTIIIDTLQKQLEKKDTQLQEKDEQLKNLIPNVGTNITFNINTFLNDTCKDAISLDEFVNNITVSVENLLLTNDEGVSAGISNIIMENMNKLALHERPIHCSDKKREVLYVKNKKWEKDPHQTNTKNMINKVYSKQIKSVHKMKNNDGVEFDDFIGKCVSNINDKKVMKDLCDNVYMRGNLSSPIPPSQALRAGCDV